MDKIEKKLHALAKLQSIDSTLDKIITLRGSLPEEVHELEDDIEALEVKKGRVDTDIKEVEGEIARRKANIKDFQAQIKKYEGQLDTVKNNREYEALTKEIEYANLEILTSEKKINQFEKQIEQKEFIISEIQGQINEKNESLTGKKDELEKIVKETEIEEEKLRETSVEASTDIEERILKAYHKIRHNMRNGLAVVPPDREACGGCFAIIPPQIQLEIRQKRKLLFCENCGRILVDQAFFPDYVAPVIAD